MVNKKIMDPSQVGISGLRGINTKEGRDRLTEQYNQINEDNPYGLSESIPEFKAKRTYSDIELPYQEVGIAGIGDSSYDKDITSLTQLDNLSNTRGELQPWYSQIGAGLAKGVVLAGTTFLDGTIGLMTGAIQAGVEQRFSALWDNPFSKAMQSVNEWSEEVLPNYYTDEEKNSPWYENIFTANFLGDKFIKNLGFTVGAFYSGNLAASGVKGGMSILQSTKLGAKTIGGASNLAKSMKLVKDASQFPSMITSGVGATMSAVNEGRIEALNNSKDWFNLQKAKLDDQFNIVNDDTSHLTPTQLDIYNETLSKISEDRLKMGNMDLLMNIPILTASNIFQFGRMYANGFKTTRKSTNIIGRAGEYKSGRTTGKNITKGLMNALSEGTEEISQKAAATISGLAYEQDVNNFYRSKIDPKAEKQTIDWIKAVAQGINETVNEGSSWEEFTIGFLTGALGMPVFGKSNTSSDDTYLGRNKVVGLRGGLVGEILEQRAQAKREQNIIDYMNSRVQSPEFKNYYQGLIRYNKYQNDMDQAIENNNEFEFKNAEYAQLISDISMFDNGGKLEDLKLLVNEAFDTSDENLESIIVNTTSVLEDGSLKGPFSQYAVKNGDGSISASFGDSTSKQEMISKLNNNKEEILSTIKKYQDIKDEIDIRVGQNITDEQLEELTWLKSQITNWKERSSQLAKEVKPYIGNIIETMSSISNDYHNIKIEEGQKYAGLSDKYIEANKDKAKIDENIKLLESIRSLDDSVMAYFLSKNPKLVKKIKESIDNPFSNIDESEIQSIITKIDDMVKLANATDKFNLKLKEYLSNPVNLQKDMDKAREEVSQEIKDEEFSKYIDSINKAQSFRDLQDIEEVEEFTENTINKSNNPLIKDYKAAKKFKAELDNAINNSTEPEEIKTALHQLADIRFKEEKSLSDLMNSSLLTSYNINVNGTIIGGEALSSYIEVAKNTLENNNIPDIDDSNKDTSSTSTTGNDETSTTEVKNNTLELGKLIDTINTSIDKESIKDIIIPTVNELEELTNKAILSKEDKDIDKSIKSINKLEREISDLPEYSNTEFRNKIDTSINNIYNKLTPNIYDVSEEELLNTTINDPEIEESEKAYKKEKGKTYEYYRSDLTAFTIDSFKDGTFIPFIDKNPSYKDVYNKIEFDYINKGNVKVGDTINLKLEKVGEYNIVFMYHNNHIVGVLPTVDRDSYKGIKGINERLSKGEEVNVTVSKIMLGRYRFDRNKTLFIKDVAGIEGDIKFGVMSPVKGYPTLVTNTDLKTEPVFNELHSDGKVYLLLPNSRGTYSPKLLRVKHFNKEEFNLDVLKNSNNTRAKELHNIIDSLSKATNPDQVDDLMIQLSRILHTKGHLHINMVTMGENTVLTLHGKAGRKNIVIERGGNGSMIIGDNGTVEYSQPKRTDSNIIYNDILEYLYSLNPIFNIRASKVNTDNYNQNLVNDDILYTHITNAEMIGSWFTTTWYNDEGIEQKAVNPKGTFTVNNKERGTRIVVNGKQYYVNKGIVYDVNENEVTENTQLIKDLAYCEDLYGDKINGSTMNNNKVLLPNGKAIDRTTQKYLNSSETKALKDTLEGRASIIEKANNTLKKLQEDQNKVKRDSTGRPDTSVNENGESVYRILEEDGQYHEYKRVHSVIGSNWILEFDNTNESPALKWGNLIDDICREYFGGNTNISKPKEMSETAFKTLMNRLEDVRIHLERTGERFLVNRLVVFKKLLDGTRVAGELDALSFNNITGNFNIYDFKTSKARFNVAKNIRDVYRTKGKNQTRSNYEQHCLQLSAYKNLFDSSYDSTINSMWIIPFVLDYNSTKSLNQVTGEQTIPITYIPESINTGKSEFPTTPPVVDPTVAALNPKSLNQSTEFKIGDKVKYTTANNSGTGTIVGFTEKMVKVKKDEGDGLIVSYSPNMLELESSLNNKDTNTSPTNDNISQDQETTYFELNGEVVSAPTTLIGNINGYEIRMYKESTKTSGLGSAETILNRYFAVFPNGNTFESIAWSNTSEDLASKIILKQLSANPTRVKEMSEVITKIGSFRKPDNKSKLAEAQSRLNATNKPDNIGSIDNIADLQPELSSKYKNNTENIYSENAYKTWDQLDSNTREILNLSGYDAIQWDSLPPKTRDDTLNCLGI